MFTNSSFEIKIKRVILITMSLCLLLMLIMLTVIRVYDNHVQFVTNITHQARMVINNARPAIYLGRTEIVHQSLQLLKTDSTIQSAIFLLENESNNIRYKHKSADVFLAFLSQQQTISLPFHYHQSLLTGVKLDETIIRYGMLKVTFGLAGFYHQLVEELIDMTIVIILSIFITLLMVHFFLKKIMAPLLYITATTTDIINHKNHQDKLKIFTDDELGIVAKNFNKILLQLHLTETLLIGKVSEHTVELEKSLLTVEAAHQAKREFVANISHEIRTPMNAIINMNRFALKTQLTDKQRNYLTTIENSASWLLNVINDTLDFSQIESGQLQLDRTEFNITELLKNLQVFSTEADQKNLELIFKYPLDLNYYFRGDDIRIAQVLMNLINNALKFTEHGEVVIHIDVLEDSNQKTSLFFSVTDTGVGIEHEYQRDLFSSFSQADATTTRKYGGTGLGLAISQKLVNLMGGHIQLESQIDKGSRFFFTIPIEKSLKVPKHTLKDYRERLQDCSILSVNHHPSYQAMFTDLSTELNISLKNVDNLAAAQQVLEQTQTYDVIFINWSILSAEEQRFFSQKIMMNDIPVALLLTTSERERVIAQRYPIPLEYMLNKPVMSEDIIDIIHFARYQKSYFSPQVSDLERQNQFFEKMNHSHILLVEDNRINQQVACELLERKGIKVTVANHGKEAIHLLTQQTFDLVLMDVQMPVMDGYQTSIEIRKHLTKQNLPIVAMTAHAMPEDKERCLSVDMNDHLAKPINPETLYQVLAKYLCQVKSSQPIRQAIVIKKTLETFPTMTGIDFQEGLARLRENKTLYLKLLQMFVKEHQHSFDEIKQKLVEKDLKGARLKAHTLKGVGANLGAKALSLVAGELETQLEKQNQRGIDAKLLALTDEIERFISGIGCISSCES